MDLNPEQLAVLRRVVDRIIPADDFPSASEVGVLDFLAGLCDKFEHLEASLADGIAEIGFSARKNFGRSFADLTDSEADDVLKDLGDRGEWFFEQLCEQTIEGYYADPGNGGNRDEIAWKMVGFEVTA